MTRILVLSTMLLAGTAWAQDKARKLVCPPNLDYCYYIEKPIKQRIDTEDALRSLQAETDCIERNVQRGVSILSCPSSLPTR